MDLYRQTVEEDGFFDGILKTIAHGVLQLEASAQGDPEMCSALLDADGTPGDYGRMHPEEEAAKIFSDGLGLGIGLGQYLLMCWRCGYCDLDRVADDAGGTCEVCRRCKAKRIDRPAGQRELFQLQWRDPRWLWQNPVSFAWYYTARDGLIPIVDGDGEWFIFRTVPGLEPWRHGPWIWASLMAIFSRDAQFDAQNTSSVCAPTPVLKAVKPQSPEARREAERKMEGLAFDNRFVLDGEWTYEIVSASADYREVCETIVGRCSDAFEVGLTGNVMGRKAQAAFTDGKFTNRTTRERRGFYAGAWAKQVREKGLTWWARENYAAPADKCPILSLDTRSPEDKLAASTALKTEGEALKSFRDGLNAMGLEADTAWAIERLQRAGIRAKVKAGSSQVTSLNLGVEQVGAVVRGAVALQSLGLDPFGDARDDLTVADLLNLAKAGGAPPGAPPKAPAPTLPNAAPPEARAAERDEEADGDEDEDAARLADEYTAAKLDRCPYHGRTHSCPRCGVRRAYGLDPQTGEPRIAWRPIGRVA